MNIVQIEGGGSLRMAAVNGVVILLALGGPLPPYNLKCQGTLVGLSEERLQHLDKHKLVGTDNPKPMLSWTIAHTERSRRQVAFTVIVAEDKDLKNIFWDSGKVYSSDQRSLRYGGPDLRNGRTYFWKLWRWWGQLWRLLRWPRCSGLPSRGWGRGQV